MVLDARAVVRFVGDLHLGDGGGNDGFGRKDDDLVAFLERAAPACDALVVMGDALDVPQALGARRALRAHPRVRQALQAAARRTRVVFLRGNHDPDVDYARLFPGARACSRVVLGDALVWHGHQLDRFCRPGRPLHLQKIALHHLAERAFGFTFRVPLRDHDTWQNRVAHWLGWQYGRRLRQLAGLLRLLGLGAWAGEQEEFVRYWSRTVWGDPNALFEPARDFVARAPYRALVCGHSHLPGVVPLPSDRAYVNVGSWTEAAQGVAVWDGRTFVVEDAATGERPGARHYAWMLEGVDPGDFFAWWAAHYLGRLRFRADAPRAP